MLHDIYKITLLVEFSLKLLITSFLVVSTHRADGSAKGVPAAGEEVCPWRDRPRCTRLRQDWWSEYSPQSRRYTQDYIRLLHHFWWLYVPELHYWHLLHIFLLSVLLLTSLNNSHISCHYSILSPSSRKHGSSVWWTVTSHRNMVGCFLPRWLFHYYRQHFKLFHNIILAVFFVRGHTDPDRWWPYQ